MKRHSELIEISREHHTTLSLSNRILNHPEDDHRAAVTGHRSRLLAHFDEEEAQFAAYWEKLDDPGLRTQFENDHKILRAQLAEIEKTDDFRALATLLRDHVRFEERTLFPAFEAAVLPEE